MTTAYWGLADGTAACTTLTWCGAIAADCSRVMPLVTLSAPDDVHPQHDRLHVGGGGYGLLAWCVAVLSGRDSAVVSSLLLYCAPGGGLGMGYVCSSCCVMLQSVVFGGGGGTWLAGVFLKGVSQCVSQSGVSQWWCCNRLVMTGATTNNQRFSVSRV